MAEINSPAAKMLTEIKLINDGFEFTSESLHLNRINPETISPGDNFSLILSDRESGDVLFFVGEKNRTGFRNLSELAELLDSRIFSQTGDKTEYPRLLLSINFPEGVEQETPIISGTAVEPIGIIKISSGNISGKLFSHSNAEHKRLFTDSAEKILESVVNQSAVFESDNFRLRIIPVTYDEIERSDWEKAFNKSMRGIEDSAYSKIVLSRSREFRAESLITADYIWEELRNLRAGNFKFVFKSPDCLFFGATPERLFKVEDGNLFTEALAGTFADDAPDPDKEKNLIEHILVRDHIVSRLAHAVFDISFPDSPLTKKHEKIVHYYTPITAKTRNGKGIIDLLQLLFPTPATAGFPVNKVISRIREVENYRRGLYAGATGLISGNGDAEFFVNLRCGITNGESVKLFAGCGLVAGSDAAKEFAESESKMKTMLSLFSHEN